MDGLKKKLFDEKHWNELQTAKATQTIVFENDLFIEYDLINSNSEETVWEEFNRGKVDRSNRGKINQIKRRPDKTVDPFDYIPPIQEFFRVYKHFNRQQMCDLIGISRGYINCFIEEIEELTQRKRRNLYNRMVKNNLISDIRGEWVE